MWSSPFAAMCANNPGYPPTRSGFLAMKALSENEEQAAAGAVLEPYDSVRLWTVLPGGAQG